MLERHSALQGVQSIDQPNLCLAEAPGFTLTQLATCGAAFPQSLHAELGSIPQQSGEVRMHANWKILRTGPRQLWIIGEAGAAFAPADPEDLLVTPLSSSRTRILLSGNEARSVLAKCAALDFSVKSFAAGQFVQTGIHHTPVLIQCLEADVFHIYALRTYALTVWEWLADAVQASPHWAKPQSARHPRHGSPG